MSSEDCLRGCRVLGRTCIGYDPAFGSVSVYRRPFVASDSHRFPDQCVCCSDFGVHSLQSVLDRSHSFQARSATAVVVLGKENADFADGDLVHHLGASDENGVQHRTVHGRFHVPEWHRRGENHVLGSGYKLGVLEGRSSDTG